MSDVTMLLSVIKRGDTLAADQLLPVVYDELRKLAAVKMSDERPDQTLQATALVHEAFIRLVKGDNPQEWNSRGHFFAAAAEAMRRILVENARRKQRLKHGGDRERDAAELVDIQAPEPREDLIALDAALNRLAMEDREAAELVQLRYFARLTLAEAAQAMGISSRTADRTWAFAKAWLHRELSQ
jgi:RNA polymerase sigma factor (TIGR02999 family)